MADETRERLSVTEYRIRDLPSLGKAAGNDARREVVDELRRLQDWGNYINRQLNQIYYDLTPHALWDEQHADVDHEIAPIFPQIIHWGGSRFQLDHRMRWRGGAWEQGSIYYPMDVVRDGDYTMVANKETQDRPAPQPTGDPYEASSLYGTLAWDSTQLVDSNMLVIGVRYTVTAAGFITTARLWIPDTVEDHMIGVRAEMWSVFDPLGNPDAQVIVPEFIIDPTDLGTWLDIPVGLIPAGDGAVFDLIAIFRPATGATSFTYEWDYKRQNGDPPSGEIWHQSGNNQDQMRVHQNDQDDVNRSSDLDQVGPGSDILMVSSGQSWTVIDVSKIGSVYTFFIEPATRAGADTSNFTFTYYGTLPMEYTRDDNFYFPPDPAGVTIRGLYSIISYGDAAAAPNNNGYGVDITVQNAEVSEDWDLLAASAGGGGGSANIKYMNWRGESWDGTLHYLQDVVRVGNWTMVANQDTTEDPEPVLSGIAGLVTNFFGAWNYNLTSANESTWFVGHIYTALKTFCVREYYWFCPETSGNFVYEFWQFDGDKIRRLQGPVTPTVSAWYSVRIQGALLEGGTVKLCLLAREVTQANSLTSPWTVRLYGGNPVAGEARFQETERAIWVHNIDANSSNQASGLQQVTVGGTISFGGEIWTVIGVSIQADHVRYDIGPNIGRPISALYDITFTWGNNGNQIPFNQHIDFYAGSYPDVDVQGFEAPEFPPPAWALNNNGYGIDMLIELVTASEQWDVLAFTGVEAAIEDTPPNHNDLLHRDHAGAHPAAAISYDDSTVKDTLDLVLSDYRLLRVWGGYYWASSSQSYSIGAGDTYVAIGMPVPSQNGTRMNMADNRDVFPLVDGALLVAFGGTPITAVTLHCEISFGVTQSLSNTPLRFGFQSTTRDGSLQSFYEGAIKVEPASVTELYTIKFSALVQTGTESWHPIVRNLNGPAFSLIMTSMKYWAEGY